MVRGDEDDRREARAGVLQSRRDVLAGAVADPLAVRDVRRRRRRQREVRAAIHDLPAGRLDDAAQPIGLGPVSIRPGAGAVVGRGQDVVGDAGPGGHRPRIRGNVGKTRQQRPEQDRHLHVELPRLVEAGQDPVGVQLCHVQRMHDPGELEGTCRLSARGTEAVQPSR